jgi:peptide/nickel transport system permease protein
VAILLFISFATFSLLYIAPGSPVQTLLGGHAATPKLVASLEAKYHLNEPFFKQYWEYLKGLLHFDFGTSSHSGAPVADLLQQAFPITLFLGVYAFLITIISGVIAGMAASLRHRTRVDRGIVALSVVGVSMPAFASGFFLMYVFSIQLGVFPAIGAGEGFTGHLSHLTLPAIALAIGGCALVVKLTRAAMVNSLEQDYVTFARARGLRNGHVIRMYALRNALIPIISGGGLVLAYVLTGAVLVEVTFVIPGLGSMLVEAVAAKDVPVVQAVALIFAFVIVAVNLVVDLLYLAVDPRIHLEAEA